MRNIEFRGQSVKNKEWVYGDLVRIPKDLGSYSEPPSLELKTCITDKNSLSKNPIEVIPETVGQYTGLEDKDDIKGYRNDIWFDGLNNYLVKWINETACFKLKGIKINYEYSMAHFKEGEIVGNSFSNPELLEEQK